MRAKERRELEQETVAADKLRYNELKAYVGDLKNWTKSEYSFSIRIDVNVYGDKEDLYRHIASELDIDVEIRERFEDGVYYVQYTV
jgi:hypothetical protein